MAFPGNLWKFDNTIENEVSSGHQNVQIQTPCTFTNGVHIDTFWCPEDMKTIMFYTLFNNLAEIPYTVNTV